MMKQNKFEYVYQKDDSTSRSTRDKELSHLRFLCQSAPAGTLLSLPCKKYHRSSKENNYKRIYIHSSSSFLEGVRYSKSIQYRGTAMPCRCKSVGETSVPGSPCLITQYRASSRMYPTSDSGRDSVVFHHLRSHLTERHRTYLRFHKIKTSSKTPSDEGGDEDVFIDGKVSIVAVYKKDLP